MKKDKDSKFSLSLRATIIEINNEGLVVEGFPQNRKGTRGKYRICENAKIKVYDTEEREIDFYDLKEGEVVSVWYDWDVSGETADKDNFESQLELTENQEIQNVISINLTK